MSIDNPYASHILADRLQRARRESSDRAQRLDEAGAPRSTPLLWLRLRRALRGSA